MTEHKKEKYCSKFFRTFEHDQEYIVGKTTVQAIIKRLSKECGLGEVIKYGCGIGQFTKIITKNAKHIIVAVLSDEILETAKTQLKEFQNITVQKASCENTSFPSGKFDTVFIANLIHVIEDPRRALQESYRILKEGGVLLIISFTSYGVKWFEKMKSDIRYLKRFGMPPGDCRNYSPDTLSFIVETSGFKVEEVQLIGDKTKALYLRGRKK